MPQIDDGLAPAAAGKSKNAMGVEDILRGSERMHGPKSLSGQQSGLPQRGQGLRLLRPDQPDSPQARDLLAKVSIHRQRIVRGIGIAGENHRSLPNREQGQRCIDPPQPGKKA